MSEYRRFFSYIYAYEQNQKTSNTGFAKIEMKGTITTIELHMRGAILSNPSACLYLFVRENDHILGFPLGDVPFSGGSADRRFSLNSPRLSQSDYTISDVAGILFLSDDKICFVSQWDEAPIDWEKFRIYEPKVSQPEDTEVPEPSEPSLKDKVIQSAELPLTQRKMPVFSIISEQPEANPNPSDQPLFDENASHPDEHSAWQMTWQQLISSRPLIQPFSNRDIHCVRIELKELRLLPPSNWHLCNNSFLLHSFFTYRHLILGEIPSAKDHRWFIGVPGIRYRQEHVLAAIFGFSDFLPDKGSNDEDAPFGYWYVAITEAG